MSSPPEPAESPPTEPDLLTGPRVMVLRASGVSVAMLADAALEVSPRPRSIRLPGADEFVCGVVNVRGSLVPLVDLGRLLAAGPASPGGWAVTLELAGRRCALAVDDLPVLCAADAPPGASRDGRSYLHREVRVTGTTLPLLDVDALADDLLLP